MGDVRRAQGFGGVLQSGKAYEARAVRWNDMSRGAPLWVDGPDENARKMGMRPLLSGGRSEDEGLFVCQHDHWAKAMRRAVRQETEGAQP